MSIAPQPSCFLAEWYRREVTPQTMESLAAALDAAAATMRADGMQVRLLIALAVPSDEVIYGMFSAYSADAVRLTCQHAGVPVERLSAEVLLASAQPGGGLSEAGYANG